jgi:hypothetical protein
MAKKKIYGIILRLSVSPSSSMLVHHSHRLHDAQFLSKMQELFESLIVYLKSQSS